MADLVVMLQNVNATVAQLWCFTGSLAQRVNQSLASGPNAWR